MWPVSDGRDLFGKDAFRSRAVVKPGDVNDHKEWIEITQTGGSCAQAEEYLTARTRRALTPRDVRIKR